MGEIKWNKENQLKVTETDLWPLQAIGEEVKDKYISRKHSDKFKLSGILLDKVNDHE